MEGNRIFPNSNIHPTSTSRKTPFAIHNPASRLIFRCTRPSPAIDAAEDTVAAVPAATAFPQELQNCAPEVRGFPQRSQNIMGSSLAIGTSPAKKSSASFVRLITAFCKSELYTLALWVALAGHEGGGTYLMMLDRSAPQPVKGLFLGHEEGRLKIHQECSVDTSYVEFFVKRSARS